MNRFRRQVFVGLFSLLAASAAALECRQRFMGLPYFPYLTGWALLAAILILALYNMRKKLPFLPLGRSEHWLQIHIYLGFFTTLLFGIHLNFHPPQGGFDYCLAGLFILVSASGVVGLFFSRILPRRLATRGGEVIFENIPVIRNRLRTEAENIVLGKEAKSSVLAGFYVAHLAPFFARPKHFWLHLFESRRPLAALLSMLDDQRRFADASDQEKMFRLEQLMCQKDGLDYHRALQLTLKTWLFVHIPLTYGLLIFTVWHIVLVFAFSRGAA